MTAKIDITKRMLGYYVLNSLDVLQGKASPYEVLEAIEKDIKAGIERDIVVPGKATSFTHQHINEQINYLELANLIRIIDENHDKRVVLNLSEMETIELFIQEYDKKPAFDVYSYDLGTIEERKIFQFNWDAYYARLSEYSKKWILSPERKASKREKQYALDRLDGVIKKIEYAITKTISKMKNRLLKPENKNIMVQEIKKEVKPSILKKLSEKKASITRNGETGKLNKESSLDNER